jgi:transcriptional regulator with XRE-family HTH domain
LTATKPPPPPGRLYGAPTVRAWTGREVRALREARRMSVRDFATHLGVSQRVVTKWETSGVSVRPQPINQQALDTSLVMAGEDAITRFTQLLHSDARSPRPGQRRTSKAYVVARHPLDGKLMTMIPAGSTPTDSPRWLPAYFIDIEPVTNAEYARFLSATGRLPPPSWPDGNYVIADVPDALHEEPIADITHDDVAAYACWTGKEPATQTQLNQAARHEAIVLENATDTSAVPRRSQTTATTGAFRCTTWATELFDLLVI